MSRRRFSNRIATWMLAACGAGLLAGAAPALRAQDGPTPGPQGGEAPTGAAGGGDEEAEALMRRIQGSLAEVDAALVDAADQPTAADGVSTARRKHLEVIRDIEALIKQIKYQQSKSSKSGGGKGGKGGGQSSGSSPSGDKPEARPSDGSSAPKPSGSKGGDKPQDGEQGAEQGGKKPTGSEQRDTGVGGNEPGRSPPPDETAPFTRTDTDARWGLLPPKLQERLMNLHVDDVPERYRAWLEAYIKALNSREQEGATR